MTIFVGSFLLLLNILIFVGIYYQREKRANDAKKKEELTESDIHCSPNSINCRATDGRRKKSLQTIPAFDANTNFAEYNCYDDKVSCKEKHMLADICSVEIPMHELKCPANVSSGSGSASNMESLRRGAHVSDQQQTTIMTSGNNSLLYPPTYSSPHPTGSLSEAGSSNSSELVTYHQFHQQQQQHEMHQTVEHCNQSTQSDIFDVHDVGTTVTEHDVDAQRADGAVSLPPPPLPAQTRTTSTGTQSPYQGGILRQQGAPTTPSVSKKRVQIQEISVW